MTSDFGKVTVPEQDTIINLNKMDEDDGYFVFGTSRRDHWNKLMKFTGGDLLEVKESTGPNGISWKSAKVPMKYLQRGGNLGLKRGTKRVMTDSQRENLKKARAKQLEMKNAGL